MKAFKYTCQNEQCLLGRRGQLQQRTVEQLNDPRPAHADERGEAWCERCTEPMTLFPGQEGTKTFIVVKDKFNDQHACELRPSTRGADLHSEENIQLTAADFIERMAWDEDEELLVGTVTLREPADVGGVRLLINGIAWLYWYDVDGTWREVA